MSAQSISLEVTLELRICPVCGISYGVPQWWIDDKKNSHQTFYCPNGHARYYPGKSELETAREQLENAQCELGKERSRRRAAEKDLDGALATITKLNKRAMAGVCPHCHRHFANVERHMKSKHT